MSVSLVTIPLAILFALLLGKVAWPHAKTSVGRTRVGIALFLLSDVLFASAAYEYWQAHRAESWVLAPEAKSAAQIRSAPAEKVFAVVGRVSTQNAILSRNWAAFTECGDSCEENYPDALLVDVDDGVVKVDDDDYLALEWPSTNWGGHSTTYLEQAWAIIVVGEAEGDQQPTIADASVVYAGPLPAFREFAQTKQRIAFASFVLDLTIAVALIAGAIVALMKRNVAVPVPSPSPQA